LPKEYKNIVQKEKTYTAKQAFIENPDLKNHYTKPNLPRPQTARMIKQ